VVIQSDWGEERRRLNIVAVYRSRRKKLSRERARIKGGKALDRVKKKKVWHADYSLQGHFRPKMLAIGITKRKTTSRRRKRKGQHSDGKCTRKK